MCVVKDTMPRLQSFTGAILKSKLKTHIEVLDIIHSAYLLLHDTGLQFSFENMRQPIYDTIRGVCKEDNFSLSCNLDNGIKCSVMGDRAKGLEHKYCKGCSIELPISFFHKHRIFQNGLITYQTKCKECQTGANKQAKAKRLSDPILYEKYCLNQKQQRDAKSKIIKGNTLLLTHFRNKWKVETRVRRMNEKLAHAI